MAESTEGNDIAWSMIGFCALAFLAGVAVGHFITGPMHRKSVAKKKSEAAKAALAKK